MERGPGRDLVDYTGLPLNDEARARALQWDPETYNMFERQCLLMTPYTISFQPQGLRIWSEMEDGRIVAWKIGGTVEHSIMTIWMDGRPHPSDNALRSFDGFSTGVWEGDTLTVKTTHLKAAMVRRGNGTPSSDQATVTAHFTRHDDLLTVTTIQEDPVYLTEPFVVTRTWQLDPRGNLPQFRPCFAKPVVPRFEDSGIVPHILTGENAAIDFMVKTYNLPRDALLGYAETTYPEYRNKLKLTYKAPTICTRYCCGWIGGMGTVGSAPNLECLIEPKSEPDGKPDSR